MVDEEPLLIADEVARLLRIKPATVYEAAAKGRIPCVRLWEGRRKALVRFRRTDIQRLMDAGGSHPLDCGRAVGYDIQALDEWLDAQKAGR